MEEAQTPPPREAKFLTNEARILIALARGNRPLRVVANEVGITERAVQRIISDLEAEGFLTREREGRQNTYTLHPSATITESGVPLGALFAMLGMEVAAS